MPSTQSKSLAPGTVGVKTIPTSSLSPNPHNPRVLFDRKPLDVLRESIAKVGILVPLTVYRRGATGQYVILDGQRRWMCAQKLALQEVPVNEIAEPTLVQNIVTMFQIHKLREDWELMPTALKLDVLMTELHERNDKKLAELTGLDQAVVTRCKKLLSYPRKYQDMMLDVDPEKRVKADFFIELYPVKTDRLVKRMEWFTPDKFTERMLAKYQKRAGIKAVTDFRLIKQHINNARRARKVQAISRRLKDFTYDDTLSLDHLSIEAASVSAQVRSLLGPIERVTRIVSQLNVATYYGEENLWAALEHLSQLIQSKLREADRRSKQ
ncbi:MAG: ParB/RepB/Spo0J family partition protein [Armatimonadetes bacterium]|nr:ParB/RepB/Spo0J family partition protein [Armatimonadota bacterium]